MTPATATSDASRVRHWLRTPPLWLTLVACAAIMAARRPDAWRNPQFWAEDGLIFFGHAWTFGWEALFMPYAGYLHVLPRIVAGIAVQFDPLWAPAIYTAGAAALTLYVAARTQSARLPFPPHLAYALAVVLVPDAFEVLLLLVNAQCVLAGALVLLLVSADPQRPAQWMHDALAAVLLGLTGPHSVFLAPLFAWRAWQRRTRASLALAGLIAAGAVVQAWFIIHLPTEVPGQRIAAEMTLAVPGMRVAGSLFAGFLVPPDFPFAIETALGVATLAVVGFLAWRSGPARSERLWVAAAFALLLAGTLYRCRTVLPDLRHATFGGRYFFVVQLTFVWLVLAGALGSTRWGARIGTAALLWAAAINLPRLREPPLTDLDWPAQAARLRTGEAVTVPINPVGWSFSVPARPR